MWVTLMEIWDEVQTDEFSTMTDQRQYMTLLGKQMENEMDQNQRVQLDTAVKQALVEMDDLRKDVHNLQPMNGTKYNRQPEQSAQMTQRWREMVPNKTN